nr:hypothetical protein [Tanacetum cinerariifolium]
HYHVGLRDSTVTYTTVSSPYEGRSRDVSPRVDGPRVMPKDPYTYVVAAFQALPLPDYVPGLEEPEQAPPSPPLPAAASPTAESPGYIPESDLNEDLEEDEDEDPEEDPADYPANHDDDDEEEEHPASADSILPPPTLCVTARISFRPQPPTLSFTKEDAERFLAMPIPPPSPLTLLLSPLPQIPSPSLPASPPILPIPLPAASPPLQPIEGRKADYGFVDYVEVEIRRRRAEDIGYAGSESHHPMLNKENYVPWSSRLLRYAKSRPNSKLIHNSILNGPYVRRMIPEPGDAERDV